MWPPLKWTTWIHLLEIGIPHSRLQQRRECGPELLRRYRLCRPPGSSWAAQVYLSQRRFTLISPRIELGYTICSHRLDLLLRLFNRILQTSVAHCTRSRPKEYQRPRESKMPALKAVKGYSGHVDGLHTLASTSPAPLSFANPATILSLIIFQHFCSLSQLVSFLIPFTTTTDRILCIRFGTSTATLTSSNDAAISFNPSSRERINGLT